jgi:HTH-type transcriptional regulator/antitoxin MqsA
MKECPICGNNKITRDIRNVVFEYKGQKITIKQPGLYCDECGEAFYDSNDIKATKKELADFKRKVDNLLTSQEIKRIRKKLSLTQKNASLLFGGGVRAFYKYESGEINQTKSVDLLLRLLDRGKIKIKDILEVVR